MSSPGHARANRLSACLPLQWRKNLKAYLISDCHSFYMQHYLLEPVSWGLVNYPFYPDFHSAPHILTSQGVLWGALKFVNFWQFFCPGKVTWYETLLPEWRDQKMFLKLVLAKMQKKFIQYQYIVIVCSSQYNMAIFGDSYWCLIINCNASWIGDQAILVIMTILADINS